MSAQGGAPAWTRPGPGRGLLVGALVVAVVLLVGSVAAAFAWAPGTWAGTVPDGTYGQERVLGPGWFDRMHDRMYGGGYGYGHGCGLGYGDTPGWWSDEPTPAPTR